jgi:hypothetical protein
VRIFARLPGVRRYGETVDVPGHGELLIETAKLADDGRDTKCTLVDVLPAVKLP